MPTLGNRTFACATGWEQRSFEIEHELQFDVNAKKRDERVLLAPLWGLVLAGGEAQRMSEDKGLLEYHGIPQVAWVHKLLNGLCEHVFVSLKNGQRDVKPYRKLPCIVDQGSRRGPAVGMLAAWIRYPKVAWLAVACDLPLLDNPTLRALVDARRPGTSATAFEHADGTPEPLCTIWEPNLRPLLSARVTAGDTSLKTLLRRETVTLLPVPNDCVLANINTPEEARTARRRLSHADR